MIVNTDSVPAILQNNFYAAIEITDRIISAMDKNKIPLNIYLDLSKAFDTLSPAYILTISPRFTVAARYIHTAPAEDNTSNQRSMYCFPQALCEYSGRRP